MIEEQAGAFEEEEMEYPKGEITRVYLEFEDGTMELRGEEAKKWKRIVDGQGVLSYIHGQKWPELNWIVSLKEERKSQKGKDPNYE